MSYDEGLVGRLRQRLGAAPGITEKKMFGGLAFLTHGNMTVAVRGDGLLARIDPDTMDAALAEPGTSPFAMSGRPMSGWLVVEGAALDDATLDHWLARAQTYVATLPPK